MVSVAGTNRTIAKNAGVMVGAQVTMWVMSLALAIFLPRYLGAAGIGKLHFANAVWITMGVFIAFGGDVLLTKTIARSEEQAGRLFTTTIVVRTIIFVSIYGFVIGGIYLLGYPTETLVIVGIVGVASLLWQYAAACRAALQGHERMEWISLADILSKAFYTVLAIALMIAGAKIYAFAALLLVSATTSLLIQLFYLERLQSASFSFNLNAARKMLRAGTPYFLSSVFLVLYTQLDVIVISLLVRDTNEVVVGWYSAADRLFTTLLFIPVVLSVAVFPAFSRLYVRDANPLNQLMSKSFDTLLLIGVPLGLGLFAIAGPLVNILYGAEFAQSGVVLAVLGIVLIFTYQNVLIGKFLISIDRQNQWTIAMAVATLATVVLDIVLVPWCQNAWGNGALGGALAYTVTEAGLILAAICLLPAGVLARKNAVTALQIFLAGSIMLLVAWLLRDRFLALPILAGAVTYGAAIVLMGVVPQEDRALVQGEVHRLISRLRNRPS